MENEAVAAIDAEIAALKQLLTATDYKALKYADGALTEEEYSEVKTQRQGWRDKINELEAQIASLEASEDVEG